MSCKQNEAYEEQLLENFLEAGYTEVDAEELVKKYYGMSFKQIEKQIEEDSRQSWYDHLAGQC